MEVFVVTVELVVQADSPAQAVDLAGQWMGDLHFQKTEELRKHFGHVPRVELRDVGIWNVKEK